MTEGARKSLEDILEAVNGLYKKTNEVRLELEVIGSAIREKFDEVDAAALAEEALADGEGPTGRTPGDAAPNSGELFGDLSNFHNPD